MKLKHPITGEWYEPDILIPQGAQWRYVNGSLRRQAFRDSTGPVRNLLGSAMNVSGAWITDASQPGKASITRHTLHGDVSNPSLLWVFRKQGLGGVPQSAAIFRVRVRTRSVPWVDVTFNGAPMATAPTDSAAEVISDPIPGQFYAGEDLHVLTWVQATGASPVPGSQTGNVPLYDGGTLTGDWEAATGSVYPIAMGGALRPTAMLAPTTAHSWIAVGDSIISISNDSFVDQALRARRVASIKCSMGGEGFYHFPGNWEHRVGSVIEHTDSMLCQHGVNDSGFSLAGWQSNAIAFWNAARAAGITRIVQTTTTPAAVTSTDGHVTLDGQTPSPNAPKVAAWNAWLRDGAPLVVGAPASAGTEDPTAVRAGEEGHPLTFVSDVASMVESSPTSGKWRVDLGSIAGDGLHPSAAAHTLMAAKLTSDLAIST